MLAACAMAIGLIGLAPAGPELEATAKWVIEGTDAKTLFPW